MSARGYKEIINKYYCATNLRYDRKQISNRIRQLKAYLRDLQNDTALGRKPDGTIDATQQWWDDHTEGHSEWKKLRWGWPEYLDQLEQIFHGVAVNGSTSFVVGHSNLEDQRAPLEQEEEEATEDIDRSPMSTNSCKRASSTSTTCSSPGKKTKSQVVRMMREYMSG
ncbi:uncharacterized protein [Miscanthus floridulus]|uniref:uncharacterized protein n=1 Tax=Miscanthus floridulus TaxID=154761 RepID=UPI00345AAF6F